MVEMSTSGSGEGSGWVTGRGYSTPSVGPLSAVPIPAVDFLHRNHFFSFPPDSGPKPH